MQTKMAHQTAVGIIGAQCTMEQGKNSIIARRRQTAAELLVTAT